MIIGSFPIAKFTDPKRRHEIKAHEFDFFFGGETNLLWKLLGDVFHRSLRSKQDIIELLEEQGLAIGDLINKCKRRGGRSSDSSLYEIEWNTQLDEMIHQYKIKRLFFTSKSVEKWFEKLYPDFKGAEKVSLLSPSAQSGRAIGSMPQYKKWKKKNKHKKIYDFILADYQKKICQLASKS